MTKVCTKCGVEKDSSMFYKDTTKPDGLYSSCKECNRDVHKNYACIHKDKIRKQKAIYRSTVLKLSWETIDNTYAYCPENGIIYDRLNGEPLPTSRSGKYTCVLLKEFHCTCLVHKLAWFMVYKKWVSVLDHINGDKLDNRLSNLRECVSRENANNLPRHRAGHLPGCHYRKDRHKWTSYTRDVSGKRIYLGHYETEKEASLQYCRYVLKYGLVRREFLPNIFTDQELYGDA